MDRALEAIERDYQEAMAKIYFSKDWGPKEEEEDH
jgi:hypothetical protein